MSKQPNAFLSQTTVKNPLHIEIVTHCYRYPQLLRYQLSSLVVDPPMNVCVTMTVCYTCGDEETVGALAWFSRQKVKGVTWNWRPMKARALCRRSIGRNEVALVSQADWLWFTDADYWFTAECWDAFASLREVRRPLVFPRSVNFHKTHALGDACIAHARKQPGLIVAERADFAPVRMRCAIGGIQIARGDVCRERGYLRNSRRFQRPARTLQFQKCREDVYFRRDLRTRGYAVDLPGVYRIRHSQTGRNSPEVSL